MNSWQLLLTDRWIKLLALGLQMKTDENTLVMSLCMAAQLHRGTLGLREQHGSRGGVAAVGLHDGPGRAARPQGEPEREARRDQGPGHRGRTLL